MEVEWKRCCRPANAINDNAIKKNLQTIWLTGDWRILVVVIRGEALENCMWRKRKNYEKLWQITSRYQFLVWVPLGKPSKLWWQRVKIYVFRATHLERQFSMGNFFQNGPWSMQRRLHQKDSLCILGVDGALPLMETVRVSELSSGRRVGVPIKD